MTSKKSKQKTARVQKPIKPARRRLKPEQRSDEILRGAVTFFAEHGFSGQTRELTTTLGISKGLLYRYFPSKDALIDRIYEEVFLRRFRPEWSDILSDETQSVKARLHDFYLDYAKMLHDYEWVRIYLFSGLAGASINQRFAKLVMERVYRPVIALLRQEFKYPDFGKRPMTEPEIELMWGLHGSIFYIGMRKWVYHVPTPGDVQGTVVNLVDGLYSQARILMSGR